MELCNYFLKVQDFETNPLHQVLLDVTMSIDDNEVLELIGYVAKRRGPFVCIFHSI